jgi:stage II sporulation protein P
MKSRYSRRLKKRKISAFLKIPLYILLAWLAIKAGTLGGNLLYSTDLKMVQNIDAGYFKTALNYSLPLIDMVYNSGDINTSFTKEIKSLIYGIFGFDLSSPLTVLNAQSSFFYNYYDKTYTPLLAQRERERNAVDISEPKPETGEPIARNEQPKEPGETGEDKPQEIKTGLPEVASSIFYDETDEKKESSPDDIISNGKVTIQNNTKYKININDLLKEPLNLKFDRKGPKIMIYHTHTTESFVRSEKELDKKDVPSWTLNEEYNVVRVGDELTQLLEKKYGIDVLHNGTVHDYPNYNNSYGNSLRTLNKYLKSYPSISITFDIHRDGLGDNRKLRVYEKVNGKNAAKVMFVVGTNGIGLEHPKWKENLKLALKLQEKLNQQCPGLARPVFISNNRYNQHVTSGSLIIEVGGDGNTLSEALESTKYLARAISDVIK